MDLFSGCGGFSLGFHRAGCKIVAGVEHDRWAAMSHAANFHQHHKNDSKRFEMLSQARDIRKIQPAAFAKELGSDDPEDAVDILLGGPPCPSFTRIGRAKLRDVHSDPEAFKVDPRSRLYLQYIDFVRELKPVVLLMENVPDLLNFGGRNMAEEIGEVLEGLGYRIGYTMLNAVHYGVPQYRERLFLLGLHTSISIAPSSLFPVPTHFAVVPDGYGGARSVALKTMKKGDNGQGYASQRWVPTPKAPDTAPPAISVKDAIGDLPPITAHLDGSLGRGRRDLTVAGAAPYPVEGGDQATNYVKGEMWRSDSRPTHVQAHVIRGLSRRDFPIFKGMEPGDQYPEAYQIAVDAFDSMFTALQEETSLPESWESYGNLMEGLQPIATALNTAGSEPSSGVVTAWRELDSFVTSHAALLNRYSDIVGPFTESRRNSRVGVPEPKLKDQWRRLQAAFEGQQGATLTDPNRLRIDIIRHIRLEAAYRNAEPLQERSLHPPDSRLQVVGKLALADVRKQLTKLCDRTKQSPAVSPTSNRLFWEVVRFSQTLGDHLRLLRLFVPPYDPTKFPNKWRKIAQDEPARTLMAHLGKDCYSHIHYDDTQARTISVREAARLQSFPDDFIFCGSMNPAFKQIGNAVPPLLAHALAKSILAGLLHNQSDGIDSGQARS